MVDASKIKELRQLTGAGITDCKDALVEANGDIKTAIEILRKKGLKDFEKRASKTASEGLLGVYVHPGDKICAVVELNCETDFVAKNDNFKALARELAMQVAAMRPVYLSIESIPQEVLEKEKEIVASQFKDVPAEKLEKIIQGKLSAFFSEVCLLEQPYIRDSSKKIKDYLAQEAAKFGENVKIGRFTRFEVGERAV